MDSLFNGDGLTNLYKDFIWAYVLCEIWRWRGFVAMPMVVRRTEEVKAAVYGGALLGGGGGGSLDEGLKLGLKALEAGEVKLYSVDELSDDAVVVTVSAVGAPAAEEAVLEPMHLARAVELLREFGVRVDALMTAENGGFNTVNGWYQGAVLGVPILDAACDGRAHPTGVMGAMGLHRVEGYQSIQAAAGGDASKGRYVEVVVRAGLSRAASMIRVAAVEAGGVVGVARNPIDLSYVKKHGAVGAISQAIELGFMLLRGIDEGDVASAVEGISSSLGGWVVDEVTIVEKLLATERGFDTGFLKLKGDEGDYEVSFFNEYMTLEKDGKRLATFPDLISLVDLESGVPITSADASKGMKAFLLVVPRFKLLLGAGLRYREVYESVENALGKKLVDFIEDIFIE